MSITNEDEVQILNYQKSGHTFHCACRMVWGDGECECGKKDFIPGQISRTMYMGRCLVCLAKEDEPHKEWCRNYITFRDTIR